MTDRRADAARLLSHLWEWLDDDAGLVELRPIGARGPVNRERQWLSLNDARDALPHILERYDRRQWHAFYGVLPRGARGGTTSDVTDGAVVWVDLDTRPNGAPKHAMSAALSDATKLETRERLARVPWRPSAVVLTGGGAHAYWRLSEPISAADCADLSLRMSAAVGGDPQACDIARLLRLPGSLNHKYSPAYPVRLWHLDDTDMGLNAEDLDAALPALSTAANRRLGAPSRPQRSTNAHPDTIALDRAGAGLVWSLSPCPTTEHRWRGRAAVLDELARTADPIAVVSVAGRALGGRLHVQMAEAVAAVRHVGRLSTDGRPAIVTATDTVRHVGRGVLHGAIPSTMGRRLTPVQWTQLLEKLTTSTPGTRRRLAFIVGSRLGSVVARDALAVVAAAVGGHDLPRPDVVGAMVVGLALGSGWATRR